MSVLKEIVTFPADIFVSIAKIFGPNTKMALLDFYSWGDGKMEYIVGGAVWLIFLAGVGAALNNKEGEETEDKS